jgi:outer membrane receptor protein involved in Fe transport
MKNMPCILTILLITLSASFAGVTGKLVGKVTDAANGHPLPGANIIVMNSVMGTTSDSDGNFILLNLPPGIITAQVIYVGYEKQQIENIRIMVDQTTTFSVALESAALEYGAQVVIVAERPMIQKDITSSISTIQQDEIQALPVASFTDILALQAGVVGSGESFNIRGGRSNETAYLIDGMYVSDPLLGGLGTQINNDAIQEMTLLSGTFNAEYGNALSGVVNIVTREGGEKFDGDIEARTSNFGVEEYSRLDETRVNGNFGGPIIPNVLNFFLSGEVDQQDSYLPFGYNKDLMGFGKLSYRMLPSVKITVSARGSVGKQQSFNRDYKYIPEQYLKRRTESWQSIATMTQMLANNLFYELKFSWFTQSYYSGLGKDTSEYITASQFLTFEQYGDGAEFYSLANPLQLTDSRTNTADGRLDLVWQADSINEFKLGLQYKKHWLDLFSVYDPKRDFPYIDDYKQEPFEAAVYLQDKLEFDMLIVNLGLRFDYANANARFRANPLLAGSVVTVKPRMQVSPRLGIAHPISERTKLHFSYGHFFQNPEYQYLYENKQYDIGVREPIFGQPNLDAERTIAYEVGINHQFSDNIKMSLTAYYKDVTGLIGTRYYEFKDAYTSQYTAYTLYINEDYANIKGFELDVDMRPTKHISGGLTYTYSVAKGSASSETEQYGSTEESTKLYYLDFDKTHVFNASFTYRMQKEEGITLFGFHPFANSDISIISRASSGYPYTPGGRDIGFVDKNSLRMPSIYSVDIKFGRNFNLYQNIKLRIFAEILNLTNHRNVIYVYSDTGDPEFTLEGNHSQEYMRDPSNYGPPRVIRLGLGFSM